MSWCLLRPLRVEELAEGSCRSVPPRQRPLHLTQLGVPKPEESGAVHVSRFHRRYGRQASHLILCFSVKGT